MKRLIVLMAVFAFGIIAFGQTQGVSQRATNGVAFGRMTVQSHINATNGTSTNTFAGKFQQGASTATGIGASAFGTGGLSSGQYSFSTGMRNQVINSASFASGISNSVSGAGAVAEGLFNEAGGLYSHAGGAVSVANGVGTFVHGNEVIMDTGSDFSWAGGSKILSGSYLSNSFIWNGDPSTTLNMDGYSNIVVIKSLGGIALIGSEIIGDGSGLTNLDVSASGGSTNEVFSYTLSNAVVVGATSVKLDRSPAFPATGAGRMIIGWGTTNAESRAVNTISGNTVSFNTPAAFTHAVNDRVVWKNSGELYPADVKLVTGASTDSGWELLQQIEEGGNSGLAADGAGTGPYTALPLVAPNSTRLQNITINAKSGYPLGNTNIWFYQSRQGGRYNFTASAATDVITISGGWNPPGSATNVSVVFYAMGTNVLPQPLSNGVPYFVVTNSSTALTVKANRADAAAINLTSDGTGVMCSEANSMDKDWMDQVHFDGQAQPNLNGYAAYLQQQSMLMSVRLKNFGGTALRLLGQQSVWENLEIGPCGIGIDMRAGFGDPSGPLEVYMHGVNIEEATNFIVLGGAFNHFIGVHLESSLSTTEPIIDGSKESSHVIMENVYYGGTPVSPNTNTMYLMSDSASGRVSSYDLKSTYMAAAVSDSSQLMLNDPVREVKIYAYNSTNGPQRFAAEILAPLLPQSEAEPSRFGGFTAVSTRGRYITFPQQQWWEPVMLLRAGTNGTGPVLQVETSAGVLRSGFGSNGDLIPPAVIVWSTPTNGITLSYPYTASSCVATSSVGITGIIGNVAGYPSSATMSVTNSTAGNITVYFASTMVSYGPAITNNTFVIPAAKKGKIAIDFETGTNVAAALQP